MLELQGVQEGFLYVKTKQSENWPHAEAAAANQVSAEDKCLCSSWVPLIFVSNL